MDDKPTCFGKWKYEDVFHCSECKFEFECQLKSEDVTEALCSRCQTKLVSDIPGEWYCPKCLDKLYRNDKSGGLTNLESHSIYGGGY